MKLLKTSVLRHVYRKHVHWNSLEFMRRKDKLNSNIFLYIPFIKAEFNNAMNKMKLKSAPDLDQIDYKVISFFPEMYADQLLSIYNGIFFEYFPRNGINILDIYT